uniref:Alpha-N-acetylglucosaminidase n=1 Tax=Plectus sambesii TaxID=2011161 RepID=A0A914XTW9_9BILA
MKKLCLLQQNETYGLTHAYAADPFNEMAPQSFNESYLSDVASAIYMGAASTDPDAIWIMQNWYLVMNVGKSWTAAHAKAYLRGVPEGRVLVLDLRAEEWPQYTQFSSYYGQPFIWNLLHNFGGVNDLRGSFDAVNNGLSKAVAYPNGTMVGVGLTMEGIFQNYVQYQFLIDRTWSSADLDKQQWITDYSISRYGQYDDLTASAWSLLQTSVYSEPIPADEQTDVENSGGNLKIAWFESYLFDRPKLQAPMGTWYDPKYLCQAWGLLVKRIDLFRNNSLFKHDVIDLTREALQLIATKSLVPSIAVAFKAGSIPQVKTNGTALDQLLSNMDEILGFDKQFSVQYWIATARAKAGTVPEEDQFEFNARNQVTLWGPSGQGLDYAKKQWSGLITHYYQPRWALFISRLVNSISTKQPFSQNEFDSEVLELVEKPFASSQLEPPSKGDWTSVVRRVFTRYYPTCSHLKQ